MTDAAQTQAAVDAAISATMAERWRSGAVEELERQNAALLQALTVEA